MWANQRQIHGYVEVNHCRWGLERFTKESLITHLINSSPEGEVLSCDFDGPENFDIVLRCKLKPNQLLSTYGEFAKEWIGTFSSFTRTNWTVKLPMSQLKLVYKKTFICQSCDTQGSKARIVFRMKLTKKETVNKHNMTITISFHHSHTVYSGEQIDALKVSPETNTKIQSILEDGSPASAAKFYYELTLLDECDNADILNDDSVNPSLQHYIYLATNMRNDGLYSKLYNEVMQEKQPPLAESGTVLDYATNAPYVTILTPTMKRATGEFGYRCVYMDTTTIPNGPDVTYLYVPTPIGALPIACAIEHLPRLQCSFILERFKVALGAETHREFKPAAVVFSSSRKTKSLSFSPPKENSKNDQVIISNKMQSTSEMCQNVWIWLNDDENKIKTEQRHTIMVYFSKLLHSGSENSAEKVYKEMLERFPIPALKNYASDVWESRKNWLHDEDNIGNHLVEMSIRIMKQFLIQKCQELNICLMVDVVAKILENHQRRIIHGFLQNLNMTKMLTKFLTKSKVTEHDGKCFFDGVEVKKINDNEYQIIRQSHEKGITLRTDTMFCDCLHGIRGELCPHLVAIISRINYFTAPSLSKEDTYRLTHIAGKFENGEMQTEPKVSNTYNEELYDQLGRAFGRVAVPLQDARHLLPHIEVDDDDEQDFDEDVEMERRGPLPDLDNFDPFARLPNGPNDPRINNFFRLDFGFGLPHANEDVYNLPSTSNNSNKTQPTETEYNLVPNNIPLQNEPSTSGGTSSMKKIYENALNSFESEFERLSKFFSENPNVNNLKALTRLGAELSKIRPAERLDEAEDIDLFLNDTNMDNSSDLESVSSDSM